MENKVYEILIFFSPDGNTLDINSIHKKILSQKNVQILKIENFIKSPITKSIYFFLKKLKFLKIYVKKKNILSKLIGKLITVTDKIIKNLISKNDLGQSLIDLFKNNKINLIVLDIQTQNYFDYSNLFRKSLNIFLSIGKKMNVPLFMISHGVNIVYHDKKKGIPVNTNNFQSDSLALCNKFETFLYENLAKKKDYIKNLGDVRFDMSWINYLKKINYKKIKDLTEKNNKLKILYVLGNLSFLNDDIEHSINKEIINLLYDFKDVEMWVKIHPRVNKNFDFKHKNLKIFYQDVDTSILVQASDVVITTLSGMLTEAILSKKLTILHDGWKKHLQNSWTIFDETNCVKKVENYHQLKKEINLYNKKDMNSYQERDDYFKKFISGGKSINESLTQNYLVEIDNLLKRPY